jgi:hypothetical protein
LVEFQYLTGKNFECYIDILYTKFYYNFRYLEVSQLVARCQHKQLGPKIFQPLLARLLQHMPQKMAWHLGPWFCSERSERHVTANNVLKAVRLFFNA